MSDSADHHLVSFFTIHYINYWMVRVIARKTDQFSSLVFFLMNSPIDHRNKPPKRWSAGLRIWLYYGAILTTAYLEHHFSSFNMSIVNLCKPLMCVKQLWTPYSIYTILYVYKYIYIYIHVPKYQSSWLQTEGLRWPMESMILQGGFPIVWFTIFLWGR